jgi:histone deacetylase 11
MIIDFDVHQGNGHENDKINRKICDNPDDIFVIDIYQKGYPGDTKAKKGIDLEKEYVYVNDEEYLLKIDNFLNDDSSKEFKADIIFYNAGTDIFENDPLGCFGITKEGIISRDEKVFEFAFKNKIPICMVLSGGYSKESHLIIHESIENILKKFDLLNNDYLLK